jgi:nitroimidazol reductase NimA-like FMN-containing flavoprotein (pyridoxamine 5'-phosphate oxidase superfamily)
MSTKKSRVEVGPPVIVRALADEPVRLRLVARRGNVIDAVGSDERRPMPFHLTRAYQFDAGLFGKMRAAFDAGDHDALNALWDRAAPFAPPAVEPQPTHRPECKDSSFA